MSVLEVFVYLCVADASRASAFYAKAFGAVETMRLTDPGGRVGHAELDFGGTTVMLSEPFPEVGVDTPAAGAPASVSIHLHVDNADAVLARAVAAGATLRKAAVDQFYGERSGVVLDPFGHRWLIGHHIEDVSIDDMQRRYLEACGGTSS